MDILAVTRSTFLPMSVGVHQLCSCCTAGVGRKSRQRLSLEWRELADRDRFIAVFPQALPIIPGLALDSLTPASIPSWLGSTNFTIWWSSGFARNLPALHHPDDGVFLTRLIAKIVDDEHVDRYRVYIAGFSSGGDMVADLAARYPEIARAFAAIASIGGLRPSKLSAPVSLFLFQGDADSTVLQPDYSAQIPLEQKLFWFGQGKLANSFLGSRVLGCAGPLRKLTPAIYPVGSTICLERLRESGTSSGLPDTRTWS